MYEKPMKLRSFYDKQNLIHLIICVIRGFMSYPKFCYQFDINLTISNITNSISLFCAIIIVAMS